METLGDVVRRDGPLNELDAVGWAIRAAKRVEALHRFGVVHGGISAESIRVSGVGRDSQGVLGDGRYAATMPGYHSPERHAGQGLSAVDDSWALAVTLYFLMTGSLPFAGTTAAEVSRRIETTVPAPLAVFDVGDDALQQVFDSLLTTNSAGRLSRIDMLRKQLEEWHPDPGVTRLAPLGDASADDEDDDEDDEARTVMRDFGDVQAHLDMLKQQAPTPDPTGGVPKALARAAPPPRPRQSTDVGGFAGPAARSTAPAGPVAGGRSEPPPPAPRFDFDDEDSEDGAATVMLNTEGTNLSAAIEEALAEKAASAAAPPGWPQASAGTSESSLGSDAALDSVDAVLSGVYDAVTTDVLDHVGTEMAGESAAEGDHQNQGLAKLLVVAIVLLVMVFGAVAVIFLRQRGIITFF